MKDNLVKKILLIMTAIKKTVRIRKDNLVKIIIMTAIRSN